MQKTTNRFVWIKSLNFWVNIGLFLLAVGILFVFLSYFLKVYTHHSESLTVPDFKGMNEQQVKKLCEDKRLNFEISEKRYEVNAPLNTVLSQIPEAGSKVKEGRKIYLTINDSKAPLMQLPTADDLKNTPIFDNFKVLLINMGFEFGKKITKKDIADNVVFEMQRNGITLVPGSQLPKGSTIDLIVGESGQLVVPDLIGLDLESAIVNLSGNNFALGRVNYPTDISDSSTLVITEQYPNSGAKRNTGTQISVTLGQR
ncbi:MAG: PASTA domain-containing protein [Bacteroidota bacterium]|nr:PASTA domain-containing protein [Bacteroidota bacterium]